MDDPNITMEEYIRLEEEKAQRHDRINWRTTTFGKVKSYKDEDDCFTNFETEFPAIVSDNTLTSDTTPLCAPTVSPPNKNKIDFRISFDEFDDEDYTRSSPELTVDYLDDLDYFKDFKNEFPAIVYNDGLTSKSDLEIKPLGYTEGIVHSYEQRLETIWSRPVNRVHVLDFEGLISGMRQDLAVRLRMVYTGEGQQVFVSHAWRRLFGIRAPLVCEFILEFLSTCRMSDIEIGLDVADTLCFQLGGISVRRQCHRMIAYKISGRGQAHEKYLFRYAEGKKSGAKLSRGYFIGRLAMHFGLVSDEGLRGLQVAAAGAYEAVEAGSTVDEGAEEILAPAQAPPPPPPAPQPRTMSHRTKRIREEMRDLQHDVVGLRGVFESFTTEQSRVSTWLISCMTQLMDASGHPY
ncbi:hypothetical protein Tco_1308629 [Tanacetum coccineum]